MTLVAARGRAVLVRTAVPADAVALTLVGVLAVLCAAATWGTWGDLHGDTGYDLIAGQRLAAGELPYADYVYYYGPLAPAVTALAVLLGGSGVGAAVALGLVLAAAIVAATYALVRTHAGPLGALIASAVTVPIAFAPNQFGYVLPHTGAATLGVLCVLLVLLALGRASADGRWLVAAGAFIGLALLTKPEPAAAALAAGGAWLVSRRDLRDALRLAAPAIALPALVYGALLTQVSPRTLLLDNLYPVEFLEAAGSTMLEARFPLTASSLAELSARLVLYAAGAAALVLAGRLFARHRSAGGAIAAVGLAAGAAAAVADPEALRYGLQFAYGWIPAGALVALWFLRRHPLALAETAALAALAATTYASFFLYSHEPQMALYAAPLAASFLVRVHLTYARGAYAAGAIWLAFLAAAGLGLTLHDARAQAPVQGPGGTLLEARADAPAYQAAVDWIVANTRPGEPILLAPQLTTLYAIADRENPLRWLSLLPGTIATAADERAAIAQLERAGVRLAVVDRTQFSGFGHTSFGGSFNRELDAWIRRSLSHAATLRGKEVTLEVWLRRTP
jgi:hypothetical protein